MNTTKMNSPEIIDWELAARILAGEADEIDHGLLQKWLSQSEQNRKEWERIRTTWRNGGDALALSSVNTNLAWLRVNDQLSSDHPERKKKLSIRSMLTGVAALLFLALGLIWLLSPPSLQTSTSLVVTSTETQEVKLSDGSLVSLNRGSKFSCSQPFDAVERKVTLLGEGFFKVKGDPSWPFVVETRHLTIKVTGTDFNVRAYPGLNITEVTVLEGEVEVSTSGVEAERAHVKSGEVALFHDFEGELIIQPQRDVNVLAWLTRHLKFDEISLGQVVETLERIYGVSINLAGESLRNEKLTAQFSHNSLDFVLNVISVTFNLEVIREGETIILQRAPGSYPQVRQ